MIESLSAVEAIGIALSGLATVIIMLSCLAGLIVVISKVVAIIEGTATKVEAPVQVDTPVTTEPKVQKDPNAIYGGETLLIDVDEKTAACVMAIVSDETGIDLSELVFKKIRAL